MRVQASEKTLRNSLEIRDAIHGSIQIEPEELSIVDSPYFQRLRQIKQLGFAEYSFPNATHNRYTHSLGTMHTASCAFDIIFNKQHFKENPFISFRAVVRAAALLHDIGHGPLSHTTEFAMPGLKDLNIPTAYYNNLSDRQATHEDYTAKIILDSALTPIIEKTGQTYGFKPIHVAALISPLIRLEDGDDFFIDKMDNAKVNFRPILHQIVSSELDADRMDYLRRDSFSAGVSYGQFDFHWLVGNLTYYIKNNTCYLSLEHKALYSFEDFLISRFHMFLMVYFHYKSVVFDEMLAQFLKSQDCDYSLPADIEKYILCDDSHLFTALIRSKNEWAKRITEKRPYRMLVELHSSIPATHTAAQEQDKLLSKIVEKLRTQNIPYLQATSSSDFSKYFKRDEAPIFVKYDNHYSATSFIPLEQCTDLFHKYGEKRSITRVYVSPENYPLCRNQGRANPLPYEDG